MANTLTATIKAAFGINYQGDNISLGVQKGTLPYHADKIVGSGTGSQQGDEAYFNSRQLSAGGNEDVDLAGGLTNIFGDALTFVEVIGILVVADENNGGNIVFGPASPNGFLGPFADASDRLKLAAGERFLITNTGAGWAVTAGTGDLLNFANDDGGAVANYELVVLGRSA